MPKAPTLASKLFKKPSITQVINKLSTLKTKLNNIDWQSFERPDFNTPKGLAARLEATLATGLNYGKADLSYNTGIDLAAPHRIPYALIRNTLLNGGDKDIVNLAKNLLNASEHCITAFKNVKSKTDFQLLANLYEKTHIGVLNALKAYKSAKNTLNPVKEASARLKLLQALNNLASNAPGLGPHSDVNAIVSDRLHIHPTDNTNEPITPRSKAALDAFPIEDVATTLSTPGVRHVVSVTGARHSLAGVKNPVDDVKVGTKVVRGALFVDSQQRVWRPKNPFKPPTGNFQADWELVP